MSTTSSLRRRAAVLVLLLVLVVATTSAFSSSPSYSKKHSNNLWTITNHRNSPRRIAHLLSSTTSNKLKLFNAINHEEPIDFATDADTSLETFPFTPQLSALSATSVADAAAAAVALVGGCIIMAMPLAADAATTTTTTTTATAMSVGLLLPSALWAYGHYVSIIVIFGCLSVERLLVKADMTVQDENTVVKLDVIYGVMAALLIISGLFRATDYGKGGDFYIHEPLFWAKMTFAGIWGGLSIFPSLTFYKRNFARKDGNPDDVPPLSAKLAARLQQVINAEISAVLTLPLLATLMARGVWYQPNFPWPVGLVVSLAATGGSFYLYGRQALTWSEDDGEDDDDD